MPPLLPSPPSRLPSRAAPHALIASLFLLTPLVPAATPAAPVVASTAAVPIGSAPAAVAAPLTNLAHLDFLRDAVAPTPVPGHDTYRLAAEPAVGVLWTYAEPEPAGGYRRLGGGRYDPTTGRWGQGAFNADDIARAAVVYLRHWRATGTDASRTAAYGLLRGLTYLQTADGPNAGNVVLWMQPDGSLNPVADPPDTPAPSDSADSYWLARTVWALGEGYAAFRDADREFAAFLADRLALALRAVERGPLSRYRRWIAVDGAAAPDWLIAGGADATGEALLGLAGYLGARDDPAARRDMARLAEGVAALRAGDADDWPYGAVLPWSRSRATWHAWAGLAPAGLAAASLAGAGRGRILDAAVSDAASFTPHLLVAGGPDNGWLPAPVDRTQIAYGVQSRVESLLRVAETADLPALRVLAGVAAAWFLGANPAGAPVYDPATGRTYDGIGADGTVNRNSGAESTIHGLLATLALDARPDVAAIARLATVAGRRTARLVEAEGGTLSGDAARHQPEAAWTGESQWSGGAGVRLGPGGTLRLPLPGTHSSGGDAPDPVLLQPVVLLEPGAGATHWRPARPGAARPGAARPGAARPGAVPPGTAPLGTVAHGAVGPQGDSPAPGLLAVRTLPGPVPAPDALTVTASGGTALVDAVLVQPELERLALVAPSGAGGLVLVRSFARGPRTVRLALPGRGPAVVGGYGPSARPVAPRRYPRAGATVDVTVPPGGFTVVYRG